jgi:beta-glucuronidase
VIRTFDEHHLRHTRLLDGLWQFITDPQDEGQRLFWFRKFPEQVESSYVPGCWNNDIGYYDYEGVAWYRTTFRLARQKHIRLVFHAVLGHADIYLDGQHLGDHYGGFTPFEFVLSDQSEGEHELVVRCDNTHTRQTIPLDRVDWFHYGGVIRSVELQILPDVFVEKLNVTYTLKERAADVQCSIKLRSLTKGHHNQTITLQAEGKTIYQCPITLFDMESKEITIQQSWPEVRLWQVGMAELYTITVSTEEDDLSDRIGFRTIHTSENHIFINGKPVYLQGVNRHEEHPEWGFAFPPKLMKKDLDIILKLGCNSVRNSHYPMSPYWIDMLDEHGIVCWSEIPMWGFPKETLSDPVVIHRGSRMIEEMMDRDMHHPSIVFWSVHNEIDTTCQEGYDITKQYVELVRSKDRSRLVTCATFHPLKDLTYALLDVIALNSYYGWYNGEVEGFSPMLQKFHDYAESQGAAGKPVLMTEFGGAGIFGDVGWEENRLFSEDYQAHILQRALTIFREDPSIAGTYVWQFADIRTDTKRFRDRARGFNNKGIVNEFRKPKQAYRIIRDLYQSADKGRHSRENSH